MSEAERQIFASDIMPLGEYTGRRNVLRTENVARKNRRRLAVGPYGNVMFESYATMLQQIHEMLYIEKGGAEQLLGELAAYNPMVPDGMELNCTLMFEIPDEARRRAFLATIGGIENCIYLDLDGERVPARPESDIARSTSAGKASAVHFLHFPFSADQINRFSDPEITPSFVIDHENYGHVARLSKTLSDELSGDFA